MGFLDYLPWDYFDLFYFIEISIVGFIYFFVLVSLEEFFVIHT